MSEGINLGQLMLLAASLLVQRSGANCYQVALCASKAASMKPVACGEFGVHDGVKCASGL